MLAGVVVAAVLLAGQAAALTDIPSDAIIDNVQLWSRAVRTTAKTEE